jgi:hypothetical protein
MRRELGVEVEHRRIKDGRVGLGCLGTLLNHDSPGRMVWVGGCGGCLSGIVSVLSVERSEVFLAGLSVWICMTYVFILFHTSALQQDCCSSMHYDAQN